MTMILLVDDEPLLVRTLFRVLRHEQFEICMAEDAAEAKYLLKARPIDLIVSDQQMPGMSGVELLSWTAQHFPDTVRILLTGWATIGMLDRAINHAHVDRFFTKPCDHEKLRSAIQDELRVRRIRKGQRI